MGRVSRVDVERCRGSGWLMCVGWLYMHEKAAACAQQCMKASGDECRTHVSKA